MIFSSGRGSRSKEEKRRDGGNFQPNGYHLSFLVPRGELEVVPSMNLLLHSKIHKYEWGELSKCKSDANLEGLNAEELHKDVTTKHQLFPKKKKKLCSLLGTACLWLSNITIT